MEKFKIPNEEQLEGTEEEDKKDQELEEDQYEEKWVTYHFNQSMSNKKQTIASKNGIVSVRDLSYKSNEEFKMGQYQIIIRDISKSVRWNAPEITVFLTIIDPEELAAIEAAEKAAKAGPGKKKK